MASAVSNKTLPRPVTKRSNEKKLNGTATSKKEKSDERSTVQRPASVSEERPVEASGDGRSGPTKSTDKKKVHDESAAQSKKTTCSVSDSDTEKDKGGVNSKPRWNSGNIKTNGSVADRKKSNNMNKVTTTRPTHHVNKANTTTDGRFRGVAKQQHSASYQSKAPSTVSKQTASFSSRISKKPATIMNTRKTGQIGKSTPVETRAELEARLNDIKETLLKEQEKTKEFEKTSDEHMQKMKQLEEEMSSMSDSNGVLQQRIQRISSELSSCRACMENSGIDPISKENIDMDPKAITTLREAANNRVTEMKGTLGHMLEEQQRMSQVINENLSLVC